MYVNEDEKVRGETGEKTRDECIQSLCRCSA